MQIGFIGLGIMGNPMCRNLVEKGEEPVWAFDINAASQKAAQAFGALTAENVEQVGEKAEVIFTMLPKNEHVRSVYEQLFAQKPCGRIYVDMSTISPAVSRELAGIAAERGESFLDAPVVKSRQAAEEGRLGIYVGGSREAFWTVEPLLARMGSSILHLGENGAGLVMKLCHNMLVGQIQNGVNEMLTLAQKAGGIGPAAFEKAVACGGARNFYLESKVENLCSRSYETAFAVEYMHKDVHLAKELCAQNGLEPEGAELVVKRYDEAMEKGLGRQDFSATFELF